MLNLPFQHLLICLPEGFPQGIPDPKLKIGDRVCWHPLPTLEFGFITGLEYAVAEHRKGWSWRYVVWLDSQSPSRAWTYQDLAWEDDLMEWDAVMEQGP
jgi:hypothetical protein